MTNFNETRKKNVDAFSRVLAAYRGMPRITEIQFRDAWLAELESDSDLFASGWYDPPPHGVSVLFASAENSQRMSYDSLRHEESWPGMTEADWGGFMFAYSSPVHRRTGEIGDFDLTLYFGQNPALRAHYQNCFETTARVLDSITVDDTAYSLVSKTERICKQAELVNCVVSVSHKTSADVGMTFPILSQNEMNPSSKILTEESRNYLRAKRRFVNRDEDWALQEGEHVSIEPQLRSATDPSLPQISFHYLIRARNGRIDICRDIDDIIKPLL